MLLVKLSSSEHVRAYSSEEHRLAPYMLQSAARSHLHSAVQAQQARMDQHQHMKVKPPAQLGPSTILRVQG